jgi:pimeloyl-ACP methyl ester carboxylesterase
MTNFILVPGMWLGGWAWDAVATPLRRAGHHVTAVTLGGLAERAAEAVEATLDSHIADVVEAARKSGEHHDRGEHGDLTLVAHSYGCVPVRGAVEHLEGRVKRVIYVDSGPLPDGAAQADFGGPQARAETERSLIDGYLIPPPTFDPADDPVLCAGLDGMAAWIRDRATPHPWATAAAHLRLRSTDQPPTDLVCNTFPEPMVREMIEAGHPFFAGLDHRDYRIHELPTGHWPMFSRPRELAALLADIAA